jgi:hypothetical protein
VPKPPRLFHGEIRVDNHIDAEAAAPIRRAQIAGKGVISQAGPAQLLAAYQVVFAADLLADWAAMIVSFT